MKNAQLKIEHRLRDGLDSHRLMLDALADTAFLAEADYLVLSLSSTMCAAAAVAPFSHLLGSAAAERAARVESVCPGLRMAVRWAARAGPGWRCCCRRRGRGGCRRS